MRSHSRLLALCASFLLLATPAAWACDELVGEMLGCSQSAAAEASMDEACHTAIDSEPMDCCLARGVNPEQSAGSETRAPSLSFAESVSVPTEPLAVVQHPTATDSTRSRWREPARYALFSSYLI